MESAVRFRRSTPADVPVLLDIWRRAVAATHDFVSAEDRAEIDRLVATQYLPRAELILAIEGDRPLGFLGGSGRTIDALFVDPDVHGRGIGTLLLEEFASAGEGELTVDVNEQNDGARRFYEARGFRVTGRSPLDDQGRPYPLIHLARIY